MLRSQKREMQRLQTETAEKAELDRRTRIESDRATQERTASMIRILEDRQVENMMGPSRMILNV